jgi:catechol 2,3-dioxygenase-like lactoylglutathione lyase family enzyme
MHLGAFSISLSVKDLKKSKAFYETLGFTVLGGSEAHHYLIMKNGNALVGLFEGMFEGNILTFNPGWDESGQNLSAFEDVRQIQAKLKANSIILDSQADTQTTGPASITLKDPDGNAILIDQHR